MNILIVEDDERIVKLLRRGLSAEGYHIDVATTGTDGFNCARRCQHDLVILDIMLPAMDGYEVCRKTRAAGCRTPILMLTALDATQDVVQGLRFGADDFISKPFSFDELLARIEALLRRGGDYTRSMATLKVNDLVFDRDALEVHRNGNLIDLTSTEYSVLELLMSQAGTIVSREKLLEQVWGTTADPLTNIVDVYIRRLRSKIDEGYEQPLIKTIRGRGYKMVSGQRIGSAGVPDTIPAG